MRKSKRKENGMNKKLLSLLMTLSMFLSLMLMFTSNASATNYYGITYTLKEGKATSVEVRSSTLESLGYNSYTCFFTPSESGWYTFIAKNQNDAGVFCLYSETLGEHGDYFYLSESGGHYYLRGGVKYELILQTLGMGDTWTADIYVQHSNFQQLQEYTLTSFPINQLRLGDGEYATEYMKFEPSKTGIYYFEYSPKEWSCSGGGIFSADGKRLEHERVVTSSGFILATELTANNTYYLANYQAEGTCDIYAYYEAVSADDSPTSCTESEQPDAKQPLILDGEFTYHSSLTGKEDAEYTFHYDENWFGNPANAFNLELAQMSIRVAMSAASTKSDNIQKLMNDLNFNKEKNYIEYPTPTTESIGYAIGSKTINYSGNDTTLILCAVRGGGYKSEWADNFNVGTNGNHRGFDTQAKKVTAAIDKYISDNNINKNSVKIWITGFSRAAATSNIAAHYLNEIYGGENVYAYCFECPQGVNKSHIKSVDKNIFNIVNDIDLVPYVAPSGWIFGRYGITCYIPAQSQFEDFSTYLEAKKKMSLEYGKVYMAANKGVENLDIKYYISPEKDGQAELLDSLFNRISGSISRQSANDSLLEAVQNVLASFYRGMQTVEGRDISKIKIREGNGLYLTISIAGKDISVDDLIIKHYDLLDNGKFSKSELLLLIATEIKNKQENRSTSIFDSDAFISFHNADGREIYSQKLATGDEMEEIFDSIVVTAIETLWDAGGNFSSVVEMISDLFDSHYPELCLSWLDATTSIEIKKDDEFRLIVNEDSSFFAPFIDVSSSDYYYEPVLWAIENGITNGTSETTFSPNDLCTNSHIITFLWRSLGQPIFIDEKLNINPFTDVTENDYFYESAIWAYNSGLAVGESMFSPNQSCTRASTVYFLWQAAGSPEPVGTLNFIDVSVNDEYADAVVWAVENGITNGTGSVTFSPNDTCTRGQIVTFLYRAKELLQ